MMLVDPCEDAFNRQRKQCTDVAGTQPFGKKLSQGATARQSTKSISQGRIDSGPRLELGGNDAATGFGGQIASGFPTGNGPSKDFVDD
jgi:hypothetical protein